MNNQRPFEKISIKDFDGNILHTCTLCYLEEKQTDGSWKEIEISSAEYDANRAEYQDTNKYRWKNDDLYDAFQHTLEYWSDERHRWPDGFRIDVLHALEQWHLAPSFSKFIEEVLVEANLFAILTSRGQSPDTLNRWIQTINNYILTKEQKEQQIENIKKKFKRERLSDKQSLTEYFDTNFYLPTYNKEFQKLLWVPKEYNGSQQKARCMERVEPRITNIIKQYQTIDSAARMKRWFSDDTFSHIKDMMQLFSQKSIWKENIYDYRLYHTGKKDHREYLQDHIRELEVKFPDLIYTIDLQKSQPDLEIDDILKISIDRK